jgi:hypothetical protein
MGLVEKQAERMHRSTMFFLYFAAALCLFGMSVVAYGAEAGPVAIDLATSATKIGWASGALALLLQIAKTPLLGGIFTKIDPGYQAAVVLVLSGIASVIESVGTGKPLLQSALEWLFTATNAMAIYTVVMKPFKKKKEPTPIAGI